MGSDAAASVPVGVASCAAIGELASFPVQRGRAKESGEGGSTSPIHGSAAACELQSWWHLNSQAHISRRGVALRLSRTPPRRSAIYRDILPCRSSTPGL